MKHAFYHAALALMREIPGFPKLNALELGCGDGVLMENVQKLGATVRGTTWLAEGDYIRERPYPPGLQVDPGVDLNKPLPYADSAFDMVYSTEVIEHVESHLNFISEASRVLKVGGQLVLTTPNMHQAYSRVLYLLSGQPVRNRQLTPWSALIQEIYAYHHHIPEFPLLHYQLWRGGFRVRSMRVSEVFPANYAALALWPAMALGNAFINRRRGYDTPEDAEARMDLKRWMGSWPMLTSSQICLRAEKIKPGDPLR